MGGVDPERWGRRPNVLKSGSGEDAVVGKKCSDSDSGYGYGYGCDNYVHDRRYIAGHPSGIRIAGLQRSHP